MRFPTKIRRVFRCLFPQSGKPPRSKLAWQIVSVLTVGLFLVAVSSSHYPLARWTFFATWVTAVIAIYFFLSVVSPTARRIWTITISAILFVILAVFYAYLCPNIVIRPRAQVFASNDDLFTFRISNETDTDLYANAFSFELKPHTYSADNFELNIDRQYLPPLPDQSAIESKEFSDIVALSGSDSHGTPTLIIYVYHLAPHSLREIGVRFNGYLVSKIQMNAAIMSYSEVPLPISKKGDVVVMPVGFKHSFTVEGITGCLIENARNSTCNVHPVRQNGFVQGGCYYIAFLYGHNLPSNIPNPDAGGSCDINKFATWNFTW